MKNSPTVSACTVAFTPLSLHEPALGHTLSVSCGSARCSWSTRSGLQAFYRETELCKLLKEVELAHRCLQAGRSVPGSAQDDLDLAVLVPLTAQQFLLLERAAVAGHGGRKPAEDAADFQIFSEDVAL